MSGPATAQDFELYRGNTRALTITLTRPDGSALDPTGAVLRWWLGKSNKATGSDIYVQKFTGDGSITLAQGIDGFWRATLTLAPDDTEDLAAPASLYHELEIVDFVGDVTTAMTGKLKLQSTIIPASLDMP